MSKIVVVGANHAGTACINTMLDNFGNENEIVVFDQNSNISFLGCGMALWIGEQIDGAEGLFYSDKEKLEAKGAKVYMNSPVLSIDYDNKVVTAEVEGKEHKESYEKLIFATGSTPILPPIEGVEIVKGNREFKQLLKMYNSLNCTKMLKKLSINLLTRANTLIVSPLLVVVTSVLNLLKPLSVLEKKLSLLISLILS